MTNGVSSSQVLASEKRVDLCIAIYMFGKKSKPRSKSRNKIICYYCSGGGHIKKQSWKFKRDKEEGKVKVGDDETTTNIASDETHL